MSAGQPNPEDLAAAYATWQKSGGGVPFDFSRYQARNADALYGQAGFAQDLGGGLLDAGNANLQLQQARRYDPSASLETIGEGESAQYILHMDKSKLPSFAGGKGDVSKYGGWAAVDPTGQNKAELANDSRYVVDDPNYGEYTLRGNLKANPNDQMDPLWKGIDTVAHIAPVIAGGLSGLGMAGGAFGALQGIEGSLANGGNPLYSLLSSLAGMTGIPGAGSLMNYIMQQLQKMNSGGQGA